MGSRLFLATIHKNGNNIRVSVVCANKEPERVWKQRKKAVETGIAELYSSQGAVIERLMAITKQLENAGRIDGELTGMAENLTDIVYRLEDISQALRQYTENLSVDELRLEAVEERLDTLQKIKRKYGGSLDAVLSYLESIEQELFGVENISAKSA